MHTVYYIENDMGKQVGPLLGSEDLAQEILGYLRSAQLNRSMATRIRSEIWVIPKVPGALEIQELTVENKPPMIAHDLYSALDDLCDDDPESFMH